MSIRDSFFDCIIPRKTSAQDANQEVEIVYILDRSASMQEIRNSAIDGFNEFVEDQKNGDGDPFMSLVLFDDRIETPYQSMPIQHVAALNSETYRTRGTTALLDAIG